MRIKYIIITLFLVCLSSCNQNEVPKIKKTIRIDANNSVVAESDNEKKLIYTTFNNQKHGIYYEFDASCDIC